MEKEFRVRDFVFRVAERKDNDSLKSVLRHNSMDSWVQLAFEREPDYFHADTLFGDAVTVIAEIHNDTTDVVGMYSSNLMPVYVNGQVETVPYLGGLRVNRGYRNRFSILKYGHQSTMSLLPQGSVPYCFTSIASENHVARKLLEANLDGMPHYLPLGNMVTVALPVAKGRDGGLMQSATSDDVDDLVRFYNRHARDYQFSPVLERQWLRSLDGSTGMMLEDFLLYREDGKIKACLAVWDQRKFKQTLVRGYRFPLNHLRGIYNLAARVMGRNELPPAGSALQQVYLSFFAFDCSSSVDAMAFVREGLSRAAEKNANVAVIGLSEQNPILQNILTAFPCQTYHSCIEIVFLHGVKQVDVAALSPQPEVAVL